MISYAEAKALVAKAQGWFPSARITPLTQDLWAKKLAEVSTLTTADVSAALEAMAGTKHDQWWKLEIAEILDVAKGEAQRRIERQAQAQHRPMLAAENARTAEDEKRGRIAGQIAMEIALKKRKFESDEAFRAEVDRRMRGAA